MTYSKHQTSSKPTILIAGEGESTLWIRNWLRPALDLDYEDRYSASLSEFEHQLQQTTWSVICCEFSRSSAFTTDILQIAQHRQPDVPVVVIVPETATVREVSDLMRSGAAGCVAATDPAQMAILITQEIAAQHPTPVEPTVSLTPASTDAALIGPFEEILDSMQDALISFSLPDHRVIFASASVEKIFGYPLERFRQDHNFFQQIVYPDDLEHALQAMTTCLQAGFIEIYHRVIWPDGTIHWLHRRAWVNYDASGRPVRINDSARDITERKEAESALRASEERQRAILDGLPDLVFRIDAHGIFVDYNAPALRLLFVPPELFMGQHYSHVLPPIVAEPLAVAIQQMQTSPGAVRFDYPLTLNKQTLYFEARVIPVHQGEALVMIRDITEQKTAETALRTSEEKYRSLIESSDSAIAMYDGTGQVLYANQIAAWSLNLTPETIVGQTMDALFPPQIAAYQLGSIRQVMSTGKGRVSEAKSMVAGEPRWYRTSVQPVRDAAGQITAALINATDITAIKTSEDALRQSEAYLHSLVNSENAYNVRVDARGSISYCNERYRQQFAWTVPSLIGQSPLVNVQSEDHTVVMNAVRECFALTGKPVQLEIRMLTPTDAFIWMHWEFSAVLNGDGQVYEIHCVGFDITRQKQAEAALQEINQQLEARVAERTAELQRTTDRLAAIFDHSGDAIVLIDTHARIQQANHAFNTLLGLSEAAYEGKRLSSFFQTDDVDELAAIVGAAAEAHQTLHIETRVQRADANLRLVEISIAPVNRSENAVRNLVCIIRDITERKHTEQTLHESEERYRRTIAAMSEGIIVHGRDGRIELCNAAAERIMGLSAEQMIGHVGMILEWKFMREDGSPFPAPLHPAAQALATGQPQLNVVLGFSRSSAPVTWILINSHPVFNPFDQHPYAAVTTFSDITTRKANEEAIKQTLAREQELSELKSRFVSMASHEFRTPLASILATTETLVLYRDRLDATKINERLERIRTQVSHMTGIVDDVLQLSRIQTGRVKYEPKPGDLHALCTTIIREFARQPEYHGQLIYECSASAVPAVFDERLLRQAISNLVHNALKYSPNGKIVRLLLAQTPDQITLQIQDEGIGIPDEDLERLFEPFHRAANVGSISGTGLGLSIAKEALELHGGTITIASQVGMGTTFSVTLPTTADHAQDV